MARKALIHKNTNLTTNNGGVLSPKLPTAGTLRKGEIAVNYKDGYETLSIENDLGEVVPFASLEQIMSYVDNSLPDLELSSNYSTSDLENEDLQLAEGDSYEEAFSKLEKAILDNEETIAASLNDLNTRKIEIDDVPTKTSQLTNDSGFLTSHQLLKTINNESLIGSGNITIQGGSGGDVNVIKSVKINGTALTPDSNKAVDITNIPASIVTQDTTHRFVSDTEKTTWNEKQDALSCGELKGSLYRANVLGSGSISISGTTGEFPTVTTAGTYKVVTEMSSTTQSYGLNVTFGGNTYSLSTTNGTINDERDVVITDNKTWSATVTGTVNSNTILSVKLYLINGDISVLGLVAVSNDYNDLYNKPIIPAAITESTVSGWGFTKNTGTYSIPTGGIPVNDLANSVQTSLGKADTALQSFTESDPTVPSHVKEITTTDINNWNNKLSSAPVTSVNGQTGAVNLTIPSAVTESTVSGWGFTKNSGTVTGVKINGTTKNPTSGIVDLGTVLTSFTETDPTVPAWAKASAKPTYTAAEVGALPDTYTPPVTSVNGQTGAVNLTIPSAPGTLNTTATTAQSTSSSEALSGNITLHKVAKTGTYNDLIGKPTIPAAVTESTVSGWGFTKNEGTITGITMNGSSKGTSGVVNLGTVLTEHQTLKTINSESIVGTGNLTVSGLPTVTASDNGKVLQVVNGAWLLVMPIAIYSGTSTPNNSVGNDGDLYLLTS